MFQACEIRIFSMKSLAGGAKLPGNLISGSGTVIYLCLHLPLAPLS